MVASGTRQHANYPVELTRQVCFLSVDWYLLDTSSPSLAEGLPDGRGLSPQARFWDRVLCINIFYGEGMGEMLLVWPSRGRLLRCEKPVGDSAGLVCHLRFRVDLASIIEAGYEYPVATGPALIEHVPGFAGIVPVDLPARKTEPLAVELVVQDHAHKDFDCLTIRMLHHRSSSTSTQRR